VTIDLKPELEALIRHDVERGAYQSIEEFLDRAVQRLHAEEELLRLGKEALHDRIGEGLEQLNRGEGITGELSRAGLEKKKAAFLEQHPHS
jgi:Arc/MetJ-type ribon-helix-helix transcriptional regulator